MSKTNMADGKKLVFRNRVVDKGQLKNLIAWAFTNYGTARTAAIADKLKDLGFRYATKAGISISVDDLMVPPTKRSLLEAAEAEIRATEERYRNGEITEVERFQKVIDTWNSTSEALKDEVVEHFKKSDPLNSVYMMAFSGARGNISQVRQLVGMRGLMADPQGEIIDLPIKTNFREGLTVTEYIISSYGARKGLVDTALRTADSGYLTRRLVDVSQDVIIRDFDCGTERGIVVRPMKDGDRTLIPIKNRLLGRVVAKDVVQAKTGVVIAVRNEAITDDVAIAIQKAGVEEVFVRSALTCEAARSVCQHCYGWSLAHAKMVDLGEAVGIIAAQSIGEPGTQLTMRTFHTGGVFTGEVARQVRADREGIVRIDRTLRTRAFRTRHGEDALYVEANGTLILEPIPIGSESDAPPKSKKNPKAVEVAVTQGSTVYVVDGQRVSVGQLLAEVAIGGRTTRAHTEKATKDVATDMSGEVKFAEVMPEEKTDRQGNTTTTAVRGGLIWILGGEVYNLPPGAEPIVANGTAVEANSVLAEMKLSTLHGGIVRLPQDTGKGSREIEIITASVVLDTAAVRVENHQGRDHYLIETKNNQVFSLLATPGTKVNSGQVVAELIDDTYRTTTGGLLKFAGVEVQKKGKAKQGYEVVKGGTLLWIPEESHEVNKDISLLEVEDGQYVEAGTEVVKDIFCQNSGVVEVTQKNDILRELVIKPGELLMVDDPEAVMGRDGTFGQPGEEIVPGRTLSELRYIEYIESPEGPALLLRPVVEYAVSDEPPVPSTRSSTGTGRSIEMRAVCRLPYKDSERVRSVEGVELLRTQLVLEIEQGLPTTEHGGIPLAADIELAKDAEDPAIQRLQLVILESLVIRRDIVADATQGSTLTRLMVGAGDEIAPGAVVARTEIQCKEAGVVRGIREGAEAIRRILVLRETDRFTLNCPAKPKIRVGDLVVAGTPIAPGVTIEESGQVLEIKQVAQSRPPSDSPEDSSTPDSNKDATTLVSTTQNPQYSITLRTARPYRVSPGAVLQVEDGGLVQRGDNLVLLVFERAKTGDIIQGLPRIEELLEARKPKEACILAARPGTAEVSRVEDETVEIKIIEDDGTIAPYPIGPGQNVIVADGTAVEAGMPLTDGPANPHEILEIFFNLNANQGVYASASQALQRVQTFLVNEVQMVYQSQGIDISDKHIEVIVRQMTSKVRIDDGGDTTMLPGELVDLRQVEQVNEAMAITGGAKAQYTPMLLGITKASLNTDSFISAASFQETTRVLTEAAIEGKSDWLRGLKENVIIGRLIPAGTGFNAYEEVGTITDEGDYQSGIFEDGEDALDVVLDDRTARAYNLDAGLGEGFGITRPGSAVLEEEDELISDEVEDLDEDVDEEEEDDFDDFDDDEE